ncbi:zinc finger protein 862-like [Saccostrea echinata]|uniref:zinc finger protein 862-like n=1 Tax=Saccostrea echinata TaxID=191078 RepID=UPI002A7FA8C1|nr:zinc finger protein 862-like [Saccostrea echinata]
MSKQTTLFAFTKSSDVNKRKKVSSESDNGSINKDEKYDHTKRKRKFQESWRERFPWVELEVQSQSTSDTDNGDLMYCSYCRTFPECANKACALFKGTNNFRIDSLISHDKVNISEHFVASRRYFTKSKTGDQNNNRLELRNSSEPCSSGAVDKYKEKLLTTVSSTEIGKAMYRLSEEEKKKMTILFNTAYAVAKNGKPFTDYLYLYELNMLNGLDLGGQYNNIHACESFVEAISQTYREKIQAEILKTNCVSILADGSTDAAVMEQEIVYLRYVQPYSGVPVCRQIDIVAVQSSDASGILAALHQAVEKGVNIHMNDPTSITDIPLNLISIFSFVKTVKIIILRITAMKKKLF